MVFSSLTFVCVFLPIVILLYYVSPSLAIRNALLIVASLLFYAYGEPIYIVLMLFSIFINYGFGRMLESQIKVARKVVVVAAVSVNLGILFVFKYTDMLLETINKIGNRDFHTIDLALPVGISFFTFQALSYVIDVYRNEAKAEKSVFNVMLYISFFPQLIAGPIVKYHDISEQIRKRKVDIQEIAEGLRRFIIGLSKKVLISNTMAITADMLFTVPFGKINILSAWIAALAYMFQIYFDFSGYSDMAIGLGHMFGFKFLENFNYPYISKSVKEFWRRWHISLSTWFKEYLYIPLGGNRKGKMRTCINKLIVFFATGLWHGANWTFVVWGLWHGIFMLLEEVINIKQVPRVLRHIYTMLVVCIGFVMFRADTFLQGILMIQKMLVGWEFGGEQMSIVKSVMTPVFLITVIIALIGSTPIIKSIGKDCAQKESGKKIMEFLSYGIAIVLLAICILNLSSGTYNPFIYFRF